MNRRPASTPRSAFTLIELLVVISIIGLLMALLLPAVQKIRVTGKRTQTGADISQLSTAAASFKQEFKFYPPDSFTIPVNKNASDPNNQIFAQMFRSYASGLDQGNTGIPSGVAGGGTLLQGIQCLIYFACGPQLTGWAIDGPFAPVPAATAKKGPFFDYSGPPLNNYTYNDPFGMPYAYFGSTYGQKYGPFAPANPNYTGMSPTGMVPFTTSPGKFVNPDSVQIISAGANKSYGPGGAWSPNNGAYSSGSSGSDDMANFNAGAQLGVIP